MALRALALVCGIAASTTLFAEQLLGAWGRDFARNNRLAWGIRREAIITIAVVTFAVTAAAASWMSLRGPTGVEQVWRRARRWAPAILLGALPALLRTKAWDAVTTAVAISAFVLLAERTFRMHLAAVPTRALDARPARLSAWSSSAWSSSGTAGAGQPAHARVAAALRRWGPLAAVVAGAILYAIYMSVYTVWSHRRFGTYNYDLGQYDNIFWSTLHGKPLRCTPLNLDASWSELRNHAELTVLLLVPFYAIHPGAEMLLIMQATILGLGAIPIYRFAARRLPRSHAMVLAAAYLLYPPLHGGNFYDFHFQPIAAVFVLATIDFLDERRDLAAAFTFVVALGCREDVSVGLALLGAFLALSGRRVRAGLVIAAVSTSYFVLMRFIVMPRLGPWWFGEMYDDLTPEGPGNFSGVIATLVTNPMHVLHKVATADKLKYALQILVPLAFLPIRRAALVLSIVPGSIFTLLTTGYAPTTDIGFQYSGQFTAYIFPAAALALAGYGAPRTPSVRRGAAFGALVLATCLATFHWGAFPPRRTVHGGFAEVAMIAPTDANRQRDRDLRELHAMIPPQASVAISEMEMAHVSHMTVRGLSDGVFDADYILYALGSGTYGSNNAEAALAHGDYQRVAVRPGLALLKKVAKPETTPREPLPTPPRGGALRESTGPAFPLDP
jgi:uncharacterized membrane protein